MKRARAAPNRAARDAGFPSRRAANGAAFALGHLFIANGLALNMAAIGGAFMGWACLRHRAFGFAWLSHSLAGQIVFTVGLGLFFHHGAVR